MRKLKQFLPLGPTPSPGVNLGPLGATTRYSRGTWPPEEKREEERGEEREEGQKTTTPFTPPRRIVEAIEIEEEISPTDSNFSAGVGRPRQAFRRGKYQRRVRGSLQPPRRHLDELASFMHTHLLGAGAGQLWSQPPTGARLRLASQYCEAHAITTPPEKI